MASGSRQEREPPRFVEFLDLLPVSQKNLVESPMSKFPDMRFGGTCRETSNADPTDPRLIEVSVHQNRWTPEDSQVQCRSGLGQFYCKPIEIKANFENFSKLEIFAVSMCKHLQSRADEFSTPGNRDYLQRLPTEITLAIGGLIYLCRQRTTLSSAIAPSA